jgi:hypothetical protein
MYGDIRDTYFPQITQTHKECENNSSIDKIPYLLGEIPQCEITAARFVATKKGNQRSTNQYLSSPTIRTTTISTL